MTSDLDKLQGSWSIAELEMDGQSAAAPVDARIVIEGSRFISTGMGADYEGTLELDASAKPARIDMKFDKGPEKGNINPGIYQIKGDSWKLCLATRGTTRPKSFKSTSGSGIAVEVLVRAQAEPKARRKAASKTETPEPSGPPTEFEGEWQMVSGVMSGAAMDAATVKWVKRITRGNQTSVVAGPQTMLKVQFTHDPSASPATLDYLNLHGSSKGKRQEGIYRFEDGLLTVCTSAPGGSRPTDFTSVKGDGRSLTAWKRV